MRGKGEVRGEGGRNDPNIVCTYEYNKKKERAQMRLAEPSAESSPTNC
jgi:hypothetical protein